MQCIENCDDVSAANRVYYSQPVWQTLQMFMGEAWCLAIYGLSTMRQKYRDKQASNNGDQREREVLLISSNSPSQPSYGTNIPYSALGACTTDKPWYIRSLEFFFPATCDILATTLMNLALLIMPVSVFQMTRGALVMWVGLLSVIFLRYHMLLYEWLSLVLVMVGVCIVGLSSLLQSAQSDTNLYILALLKTKSHETASQTLLGLVMVLGAQVFSATQFVWEEKVMEQHRVDPLLVVGLEGIFGICQITVGMLLMHYFVGSTRQGEGGIFDLRAGWSQTLGVPSVRMSAFLCATSIAIYNALGLNVTKDLSATARSTIDTFRTLGICAVSLCLGWEILRPLSGSVQGLGFVIMAYGTFVFNGVISAPAFLLRRSPVAHTA